MSCFAVHFNETINTEHSSLLKHLQACRFLENCKGSHSQRSTPSLCVLKCKCVISTLLASIAKIIIAFKQVARILCYWLPQKIIPAPNLHNWLREFKQKSFFVPTYNLLTYSHLCIFSWNRKVV